ncbi:9489_t:CDS:2 [Acaulospora colombiana]|uniref:9489_t:CDS:1 n=1 Tax=Acaulospora colombiana TaxID=27376 RepID=A0ACA9N2E4_9GLOM|nr:9489_t:CDS:2 [Acaulospora colombiana]
MFKFHFGQVLDYPIDEDDAEIEALNESLGEIIITPEQEDMDRAAKSLPHGALPLSSDPTIGNHELQNCEEILLKDILQTLPSAISYTPLVIKSSGSSSIPTIVIPRRDLYDARFQIISEEDLTDDDDDTEMGDESDDDSRSEASMEILRARAMRLRSGVPDSIMEEDLDLPPLPPSPPDFDESLEQEIEIIRPDSAPDSLKAPSSKVISISERPPRISRSDRISRIKDLEYINAPSDVIPNVYEGGLKTWECSIDLVEYLSSGQWQRPLQSESSTSSQSQRREDTQTPSFQGKAILEVGCGTAIPTSFILRSLFNEPLKDDEDEEDSGLPEGRKETVIHLQDYNKSVLELCELTNTFADSSDASQKYKNLLETSLPDPASASELSIDQMFLDHFLESLQQHRIKLRLWAGPWSNFNPRKLPSPTIEPVFDSLDSSAAPRQNQSARPFDLVLTSETIYRSANVPSLLRVLRSACAEEAQPVSTTPGITKPLAGVFSLFGQFGGLSGLSPRTRISIILVAAKVLYFGVGGSVDEFESMSRNMGASVDVVMEKNVGVGRRILQLAFR